MKWHQINLKKAKFKKPKIQIKIHILKKINQIKIKHYKINHLK